MHSRRNISGFTLIELSIVLIIIGLISAAILVGRDLIHAATIRATIKQVEEFNTAANTFRVKYNCLPGDCRYGSEFGFDATADGNGDGMIGFTGGCLYGEPCELQNRHEYIDFWYHLSAAQLIGFAGRPSGGGFIDEGQYPVGIFTPPIKLTPAYANNLRLRNEPANQNGGWSVHGRAEFGGDPIRVEKHMFTIVSVSAVPYFAIQARPYRNSYYPKHLYDIDSKIDDGLPRSGGVRAGHYIDLWFNTVGYPRIGGTGGAGSDVCVRQDRQPEEYNVQRVQTGANLSNCGLAVTSTF